MFNVPSSTAVQQTATCGDHEGSLSDFTEDSSLPAYDALTLGECFLTFRSVMVRPVLELKGTSKRRRTIHPTARRHVAEDLNIPAQ